MRVGYLVFSHARTDRAARLAATLRRGDPAGRVWVHHDARAGEPGGRWDDLGVTLVPDPLPVLWSDFSWVEAVLKTARLALDGADPPDWLVLLSEACHPLRPARDLHALLASAEAEAFIESFDPHDPPRVPPGSPRLNWHSADVGPDRHVRYRWHRLPTTWPLRPVKSAVWHFARLFNRQRLARLAVDRAGLCVGVRRLRRPPFAAPRAGGNWSMLSRRAARAVLDLVDREPAWLRWYRHTRFSEEAFFQTALHHLRVPTSDASLRWVQWDAAGVSQTLGPDDVDRALASGCMFGRKWADDPAVLERLGHTYLGQGVPS